MTGRGELSADMARALRRDLKGAVTGFANGQGGVEALLHEIERTAQYVAGKPNVTLRQATKAMKRLVRRYAPARLEDTGLPGVRWDDLYDRVVEGRNDIAHTGTEAALAGTLIDTSARPTGAHSPRSAGRRQPDHRRGGLDIESQRALPG